MQDLDWILATYYSIIQLSEYTYTYIILIRLVHCVTLTIFKKLSFCINSQNITLSEHNNYKLDIISNSNKILLRIYNSNYEMAFDCPVFFTSINVTLKMMCQRR